MQTQVKASTLKCKVVSIDLLLEAVKRLQMTSKEAWNTVVCTAATEEVSVSIANLLLPKAAQCWPSFPLSNSNHRRTYQKDQRSVLVRATPVLPILELDEPISHWQRLPAEAMEKGEELPSCPMNSLRYFILFERQESKDNLHSIFHRTHDI